MNPTAPSASRMYIPVQRDVILMRDGASNPFTAPTTPIPTAIPIPTGVVMQGGASSPHTAPNSPIPTATLLPTGVVTRGGASDRFTAPTPPMQAATLGELVFDPHVRNVVARDPRISDMPVDSIETRYECNLCQLICCCLGKLGTQTTRIHASRPASQLPGDAIGAASNPSVPTPLTMQSGLEGIPVLPPNTPEYGPRYSDAYLKSIMASSVCCCCCLLHTLQKSQHVHYLDDGTAWVITVSKDRNTTVTYNRYLVP